MAMVNNNGIPEAKINTDSKDLVNIVLKALPNDVNTTDILSMGKAEWWISNQNLALAYALRYSPRFNWRAYIESNPDLKEARVDPVLHFLKHGIYEGRKLISWNRLHDSMYRERDAPKITLIIPSYNNDIYLTKCLNSAINQTLKDIEIIIVDDGSTDDSLDIANYFAKLDSRVKVMPLVQNMGTHIVRKRGVAVARGDYIMFVDADDFLTLDACEKAYDIIVKGYDMVAFECNLVYHEQGASNGNKGDCRTKWFGKLPNGVYGASEKTFLAFGEYKLPCFMGGKIYERSVAQKAFSEMGEFYSVFLEDMYAFLIINHYSRNLYKTDEVLFNYAIGSGISNRRCSRELALNPGRHLKILQYFREFCEANSYSSIYEYFRNFIFTIALEGIDFVQKGDANAFFLGLSSDFGVLPFVRQFMRVFKNRIDQVAMHLQYFSPEFRSNTPKNIAILHHNLCYGYLPGFITILAKSLLESGYNVELFIEAEAPESFPLPVGIRISYLADSRDYQRNGQKHLSDLYTLCERYGIDTLIYIPGRSPMLIWDTLLLKLLKIKTIAYVDVDINLDLLSRNQSYSQKHFHATLRCMDKVICTNTSSELYLRANNVNAINLPPGIMSSQTDQSYEGRDDIILVFDALGNRLKCSREALLCLGEIIKYVPGAQMTFVGGLADAEFYKIVDEMDLRDNIKIIGSLANHACLFAKSKVVFSGAFIDGYPFGIATAQAHGLPAVIYDVDIDLAIDNSSIIRVQQGDFRRVAVEIIALLTDSKKWISLSRVAHSKIAQYTPSRFKSELKDILENCQSYSKVNYYTDEQWCRVLDYMSFYAGKTLPQG